MNKYNSKLLLITLAAIASGFFGINSTSAEYSKIPLRNEIKDNFAGIQLKGGVKIDHKKQVVSLNLRDSNLRQVLRMLADKAGMNVIIHDSITATDTISLDLMNVELNKAFEYIMTIKSLTYWKDGNTLIIANREAAKTLSLNVAQIKAIKIKYTEAQKIANFLNKNIFTVSNPNISNASIVTTNPNTNEILLFGNDNDIKLAEDVVKYLDAKPNVKSFTVNFANPIALASKICWTVFKSSDGESDFSREAELEEGSNIKLVCGNTAEPGTKTDSDSFEDYNTPSFWILADTGLNQVTIYGGTSEQLYMAEEIIKNFDKREPQVLLEISILELTDQDTNSAEWNQVLWNNKNGGFLAFAGSTFQVQDFRQIIKRGGKFLWYDSKPIEEGGDNPAFLETVMEKTKARLLANPRIISANNVKSSINISSDVVQSVTSTTSADGVVTHTVNIGTGDGISFSVLPKISPNGYVTISIPDFTLSSDKGTITVDESTANLTSSTSVEVKSVRVKDGNTFVISGLIQEREKISRGSVPLLGSIPILGTMFQQQQSTKTRSELILMITPRILQDPDEISEKL